MRDASETARYLSLYRVHPGMMPHWLDKPAPDYFTPEDARNLVERSLKTLKLELGIKNAA